MRCKVLVRGLSIREIHHHQLRSLGIFKSMPPVQGRQQTRPVTVALSCCAERCARNAPRRPASKALGFKPAPATPRAQPLQTGSCNTTRTASRISSTQPPALNISHNRCRVVETAAA